MQAFFTLFPLGNCSNSKLCRWAVTNSFINASTSLVTLTTKQLIQGSKIFREARESLGARKSLGGWLETHTCTHTPHVCEHTHTHTRVLPQHMIVYWLICTQADRRKSKHALCVRCTTGHNSAVLRYFTSQCFMYIKLYNAASLCPDRQRTWGMQEPNKLDWHEMSPSQATT